MPRRRRRSSATPWIVVVVLAVVAVLGWQQRATLKALWAPAAAARTACQRIPIAQVQAALKVPTLAAEAVVAANGSAQSDGCRWRGGGLTLTVGVFSAQSLAQQLPPQTPASFYESAVTGLEYDRKETPRSIAGLGQAAAAAGFRGHPDGDLVVQAAERVVQVSATGASEAQARALAELALASYGKP